MNSGFITLSSNTSPASTRANATFLPGGPAYRCPETRFGACVYYACTRRTPDSLPVPSAGVIDVTGGTSTLTFTPLTDGTYDTVTRQSSLWTSPVMLDVTAAGAEIPAFAGAWSTPARVTVSAPVPSDPWVVTRSGDVTLVWTGGTTEEVVATFGSLASNDPTEVECTFPASAGTGVVPAAALGMLPAGDGYYGVVSRTRSVVGAGVWHVTLRAESDAVTTSQAPFYGGATFQ
jgi:hypothetical protein